MVRYSSNLLDIFECESSMSQVSECRVDLFICINGPYSAEIVA